MKLVKPKRSDFEKGHHGKADYAQAVQVYYLVATALSFGTPFEAMAEVLEKHDGGFMNWKFLVAE